MTGATTQHSDEGTINFNTTVMMKGQSILTTQHGDSDDEEMANFFLIMITKIIYYIVLTVC